MAIHKLTVRKVDTAGPGKYEDGGGLRLVVSPTGAKKWVLRYASQGKRREMGLGRYPDVGLADARTQALQGRKTVGDRGGPYRRPPGDPGDESCLYDLRRTVYPSPSAQLAECQAHAAMGSVLIWLDGLFPGIRPVICNDSRSHGFTCRGHGRLLQHGVEPSSV